MLVIGECLEDLLEAELKSTTAPPVSRKRHRESGICCDLLYLF